MEKYNLTQTGSEVQEILDGAAMQSDITAEKERAELAEHALDLSLDAEQLAREQADQALQGNIDAEETRAKAAEKQNADDIDAIEAKIPAGASDENPLTTKEYVDDSIATASATFRGTYNLVSDLHLQVTATHADIANALATAIATADNNDYAFVQVPTSNDTPTEISKIERYKFNGSAWSYEYDLNNSGFTSDQWDAINSGITNGLVQKLLALPTNAALQTLLNGKQDALTFDSTPTQNSQNPVTSGGVYTGIHNEAEAREESDHTLEVAIQAILALIPSEATAANQLADKAFVNSSIATNTATFRGTFNLVSDLHLLVTATHGDIENALGNAISSVDNNDYCFVQIPTSNDTPTEIERIERYKYNGTVWLFEYELNNSGFTSAQWAAINSGITQQAITTINERISTNEDDIAILQAAYTAMTQSDIIIVNGALPTSGQQLNKIYRQPDQDNNPPQYYRDYMWSGSAWVLMGQYDMNIDSLVGYYECDTAGATAAKVVTAAGYALPVTGGAMKIKMANRNTVANATLNINSTGAKPLFYNGQRAGVGNTWDTNEIVTVFYDGTNYQAYNVAGSNGDGVFDISTYNATGGTLATYADLEAALGVDGANIPQSLRKGGMSVKFVHNSDNNYIQARCIADEFTTDVTQWQSVDKKPTKDSQNLVRSDGVYNELLDLSLQAIQVKDKESADASYDTTAITVSGKTLNDSISNSITYLFDVKYARRVVCKLYHSNTNIYAITFCNAQEVSSSTVMIESVVATVGYNEYDVEVPNGCKYIYVTHRTNSSNPGDVCEISILGDNVKKENDRFEALDDKIDEEASVLNSKINTLEGDIKTIGTKETSEETYNTTAILVTSKTLNQSISNSVTYMFPVKEVSKYAKRIICELYHSGTNVYAITFCTEKDVHPAQDDVPTSVMSESVVAIAGYHKYDVEVPEGCEYIYITHRTSSENTCKITIFADVQDEIDKVDDYLVSLDNRISEIEKGDGFMSIFAIEKGSFVQLFQNRFEMVNSVKELYTENLFVPYINSDVTGSIVDKYVRISIQYPVITIEKTNSFRLVFTVSDNPIVKGIHYEYSEGSYVDTSKNVYIYVDVDVFNTLQENRDETVVMQYNTSYLPNSKHIAEYLGTTPIPNNTKFGYGFALKNGKENEMQVYNNGVRLFYDKDYHIDTLNRQIILNKASNNIGEIAFVYYYPYTDKSFGFDFDSLTEGTEYPEDNTNIGNTFYFTGNQSAVVVKESDINPNPSEDSNIDVDRKVLKICFNEDIASDISYARSQLQIKYATIGIINEFNSEMVVEMYIPQNTIDALNEANELYINGRCDDPNVEGYLPPHTGEPYEDSIDFYTLGEWFNDIDPMCRLTFGFHLNYAGEMFWDMSVQSCLDNSDQNSWIRTNKLRCSTTDVPVPTDTWFKIKFKLPCAINAVAEVSIIVDEVETTILKGNVISSHYYHYLQGDGRPFTWINQQPIKQYCVKWLCNYCKDADKVNKPLTLYYRKFEYKGQMNK